MRGGERGGPRGRSPHTRVHPGPRGTSPRAVRVEWLRLIRRQAARGSARGIAGTSHQLLPEQVLLPAEQRRDASHAPSPLTPARTNSGRCSRWLGRGHFDSSPARGQEKRFRSTGTQQWAENHDSRLKHSWGGRSPGPQHDPPLPGQDFTRSEAVPRSRRLRQLTLAKPVRPPGALGRELRWRPALRLSQGMFSS